jgi:hypothetical protein
VRNIGLLLILVLSLASVAAERAAYLGRWDLTVRDTGVNRPSWLEVRDTAAGLAGDMVAYVGSAHPVRTVKVENGRLTLSSSSTR